MTRVKVKTKKNKDRISASTQTRASFWDRTMSVDEPEPDLVRSQALTRARTKAGTCGKLGLALVLESNLSLEPAPELDPARTGARTIASIWLGTPSAPPSGVRWVRQRCRVSCVTGASNWYWLTVGQGLLSLQQVRVEGECFIFYCFLTFIQFPLSPLSLSFIASTVSSISVFSFSGRRYKMTHKGWGVVKPQHNQSVPPWVRNWANTSQFQPAAETEPQPVFESEQEPVY